MTNKNLMHLGVGYCYSCKFINSQVAKWMLSKGQGATMGTYDTLLLAFDKDHRADEAESLWNMILHTHTRSISKRLFSRMISLYDHHDMPDKIIEVIKDGVAISAHFCNDLLMFFQMINEFWELFLPYSRIISYLWGLGGFFFSFFPGRYLQIWRSFVLDQTKILSGELQVPFRE